MQMQQMFPLLEVVVHQEGHTIARAIGNWANSERGGIEWDATKCLDDGERLVAVYGLMALLVGNITSWDELQHFKSLYDEYEADHSVRG